MAIFIQEHPHYAVPLDCIKAFVLLLKGGHNMANSVSVISKINDFITSKHDLDTETIEFLIGLKQDVLSIEDAKPKSEYHSKELPPVEKLLRTMGKKAFLDSYEALDVEHKLGDLRNAQGLISKMKEAGIAGGEMSMRVRASTGRKIFREGLNIEALESIAHSHRTGDDVKAKAEKLLKQYGERS